MHRRSLQSYHVEGPNFWTTNRKARSAATLVQRDIAVLLNSLRFHARSFCRQNPPSCRWINEREKWMSAAAVVRRGEEVVEKFFLKAYKRSSLDHKTVRSLVQSCPRHKNNSFSSKHVTSESNEVRASPAGRVSVIFFLTADFARDQRSVGGDVGATCFRGKLQTICSSRLLKYAVFQLQISIYYYENVVNESSLYMETTSEDSAVSVLWENRETSSFRKMREHFIWQFAPVLHETSIFRSINGSSVQHNGKTTHEISRHL